MHRSAWESLRRVAHRLPSFLGFVGPGKEETCRRWQLLRSSPQLVHDFGEDLKRRLVGHRPTVSLPWVNGPMPVKRKFRTIQTISLSPTKKKEEGTWERVCERSCWSGWFCRVLHPGSRPYLSCLVNGQASSKHPTVHFPPLQQTFGTI